MISIETIARLLGALAVTLRVPIDGAQIRMYHRVLAHVPEVLLERATVAAAAQSSGRFPKPGELLQLADQERQRIIDAHPFEACAICARSPGWQEIESAGAKRLTRCACYRSWQARLAMMGAGVERLLVEGPTERETP